MSNPFPSNPFGGGPYRPQQPPRPPAPPRDEVNVLATLSVVFAFVFAPAGVLFGHLGLAQIRRTGERGRDRALIGTTLSYVFLTVAAVALIVGATLPNATPKQVTAPTATTTSPASSAPPTVTPADITELLPAVDDIKNFTGDTAIASHRTYRQPTTDPQRSVTDRPDCWGAFEAGVPEAYGGTAITGYALTNFLDTADISNQWSVDSAVIAFPDANAAQSQLAKLRSIWRRCDGPSRETRYDGSTYAVVTQPAVDAGNGVMTLATDLQSPVKVYGVRSIAAKANVVVDAGAWSTNSSDRARQVALAVANLILGKIPG